ncbi:hypothetical protein C9374_010976 [Naegleria lovaniensis]|uniref:Uncharacterized protein n=1 Tax=Naegleria lovaniensis TaxID=51637 RepID=A0AA88GEX6_NAELO|nr:uncharacterized protein C9374_010976 [Naegleria lovaniensis]KAG2374139.1 hypothetical protein C9374_010976 [Naegleria lovaniensis]
MMLPSSSPLLAGQLQKTPVNTTPSKVALSPSKSLSERDLSCSTDINTSKQESRLQREVGFLSVQGMTLNKSDCSAWSSHDIHKLLTTPKTSGGIGLVAEQIVGVTLYGSDLETVVDALIRFEGDDEDKIEHACAQIFIDDLSMRIRQPIVRWILQNLLKRM